MNNYMLGDLIYFRKLLISYKTKHLTKNELLERVDTLDSINVYLDDFKKNDPNIESILIKLERQINKLCTHKPVIDWVEDVAGDEMFKIKYCSLCELNLKF